MTRAVSTSGLKAMVYNLKKKRERENGGLRHLSTLAWIR